jgi:hypothetical protein
MLAQDDKRQGQGLSKCSTPLGSDSVVVDFYPQLHRFALYWGLSLLNAFGVLEFLRDRKKRQRVQTSCTPYDKNYPVACSWRFHYSIRSLHNSASMLRVVVSLALHAFIRVIHLRVDDNAK